MANMIEWIDLLIWNLDSVAIHLGGWMDHYWDDLLGEKKVKSSREKLWEIEWEVDIGEDASTTWLANTTSSCIQNRSLNTHLTWSIIIGLINEGQKHVW